jgi:hypothetical protein
MEVINITAGGFNRRLLSVEEFRMEVTNITAGGFNRRL